MYKYINVTARKEEEVTLPLINARVVYDYLTLQDSTSHKAPIFILGAGSLGPASRAAEIYKSSPGFRPVFFTSRGGNFGGNIVFGRDETEEYKDHLERLGVPDSDIFYLPECQRTTNTLMEAKAALPFIEGMVGAVQDILLCSRPIHQRRAWATFTKQWPGVKFHNHPCEELLTVEHLPRLVQEIDRLRQYGEKGDLLVQDIPDEVEYVCGQLRSHLKMPPP